MLNRILFLFVLSGALVSLQAQETKTTDDPLRDHLIAPELVMQHQQAIGLSEAQKTTIKKEVKSTQSRFFDLQWDLKEQMDQFAALLSKDQVEEEHALAQLEKILAIESDIKKAQMTLMIRIKNVLTPQQQREIKEIRSRR